MRAKRLRARSQSQVRTGSSSSALLSANQLPILTAVPETQQVSERPREVRPRGLRPSSGASRDAHAPCLYWPGAPALPGAPLPPVAVAAKFAGAWIDAAP